MVSGGCSARRPVPVRSDYTASLKLVNENSRVRIAGTTIACPVFPLSLAPI